MERRNGALLMHAKSKIFYYSDKENNVSVDVRGHAALTLEVMQR